MIQRKAMSLSSASVPLRRVMCVGRVESSGGVLKSMMCRRLEWDGGVRLLRLRFATCLSRSNLVRGSARGWSLSPCTRAMLRAVVRSDSVVGA